MLHEKGAWLSGDYQELLDLAAEWGNREIIRMLENYNVRNLHSAQSTESARTRNDKCYNFGDGSDVESQHSGRGLMSGRDRDRQVQKNSADIVEKLIREFLVLKGQPGKWTGIKDVRILRAANPTVVSEKLLIKIRPHLPSLRGVIQDRPGGTFEETVDKRPRRYTADTTPQRNESRRTRERDYVRALCQSYSNL